MMAALALGAMTLGELLGATAGRHAGIEVKDLVLDSREVRPGAAFVALPGLREHGIRYAEQALANGAAVVLYEPPLAAGRAPPEPSVPVEGLRFELGALARKFFGRGTTPPELFAVTGTNGKTTVAFLVAQALTQVRGECGYIGTLGYGVPPALTAHALTTPDCLTLHRELRAIGAPYGALEASSHALSQDRLAGLAIRVAGFTNLTRDHLDHHGDLGRYAEAKAMLFERPELEHAVINLDDAFGRSLAARPAVAPRLLGVSLDAAAAARLTGRVTHAGIDGLAIEIGGAFGRAALSSRLVGDFNAENLLLALGTLLTFEVPLAEACAGLERCAAAPGRMELIDAPTSDAPRVVVDYAHTPDALARALASLRRLLPADATIWCVFGCGGERDQGKRPLMGEVASDAAEHLIVTDDNPRGEDPAAITDGILRGIGTHADVRVIHDRAAAIRAAIRSANAADVVLIAGKGHETTQRVGAAVRPLSDRELAAAVLRGDA